MVSGTNYLYSQCKKNLHSEFSITVLFLTWWLDVTIRFPFELSHQRPVRNVSAGFDIQPQSRPFIEIAGWEHSLKRMRHNIGTIWYREWCHATAETPDVKSMTAWIQQSAKARRIEKTISILKKNTHSLLSGAYIGRLSYYEPLPKFTLPLATVLKEWHQYSHSEETQAKGGQVSRPVSPSRSRPSWDFYPVCLMSKPLLFLLFETASSGEEDYSSVTTTDLITMDIRPKG